MLTHYIYEIAVERKTRHLTIVNQITIINACKKQDLWVKLIIQTPKDLQLAIIYGDSASIHGGIPTQNFSTDNTSVYDTVSYPRISFK